MDTEVLIMVLENALKKACKFISNNPPADLYKLDMIQTTLVGEEQDKDEKHYVDYFIKKAFEEMMDKGELE